jgi:hypothetical protein
MTDISRLEFERLIGRLCRVRRVRLATTAPLLQRQLGYGAELVLGQVPASVPDMKITAQFKVH